MHLGVEEEAEIREMEARSDSQKDFDQREPDLNIPHPPQSKGIHFEAKFLESMMTESSYTAGPSSQPSFTEFPHTEIPSRHLTLLIMLLRWIYLLRSTHLALQTIFEHLQQSIERIESRQESQHEEMMAYLCFVFPPPQS
ncbi:hypothetical protein AAG906_004971 [Vitis piasezkii]